VPKLGMGPIRREQICRAAAKVIAREGFAGTTMRTVASEAGVSTGMLNHYFANRAELLTQALVFASERSQQRHSEAIDTVPAGVQRLSALIDSVLADDEQTADGWRVWINAYGEAVRLPALRQTMDERKRVWHEIVERALEGLLPPGQPVIPWSWRFDVIISGLMIKVLTSGAEANIAEIREEAMHLMLPELRPQSQAVGARNSARGPGPALDVAGPHADALTVAEPAPRAPRAPARLG
jgi:TetR/AcrR family transcriptional repressor of bet genes